MLTLYDYFRSSASYRVRIALNLKNLPYDSIPINLINNGGEQFSLEYQAINPQCLVPALQDDDKVITQSLAIIEYLDELQPEPTLLSHDLYKKALIRAFALVVTADTHPLNNLRVLQFLTNELGISEDQKTQWYQHWMAKGLEALEKQLVLHNHSHPFCFGDTPSVADICLVPQLYNARRFACDLTLYPLLVKVDAVCQAHPAFIKASPEAVHQELKQHV